MHPNSYQNQVTQQAAEKLLPSGRVNIGDVAKLSPVLLLLEHTVTALPQHPDGTCPSLQASSLRLSPALCIGHDSPMLHEPATAQVPHTVQVALIEAYEPSPHEPAHDVSGVLAVQVKVAPVAVGVPVQLVVAGGVSAQPANQSQRHPRGRSLLSRCRDCLSMNRKSKSCQVPSASQLAITLWADPPHTSLRWRH